MDERTPLFKIICQMSKILIYNSYARVSKIRTLQYVTSEVRIKCVSVRTFQNKNDVVFDMPFKGGFVQEEWEVLIDFPMYAISNLGNIINVERGLVMSQRVNNRGIRMVSLMNESAHMQVTRSVALLVADAFIPQHDRIFNAPIHLDGDRSNCEVPNLMWRPRWFAVQYHKQFLDPRFYHREIMLAIKGTKESFQGWAPPSVKYGLLYKSIIDSYHSGHMVFPTGQIFENLSW